MTKFDIINMMVNVYDYSEYVSLCKSNEVDAISWISYVQTVETLKVASEKYPGLPAREAFLKAIKDNDNTLYTGEEAARAQAPLRSVPCGGCGGGRVV